jgi:4-amino-4-deoxy-L-arabinose transferase-like glycosyltransferase
MFGNVFGIIRKSKIWSLSKQDFIFLSLILLSFAIRLIHLNYNSAFNDEAIYIVIGRMGLFSNDWYSYGASLWMAGLPYIYPTLTALIYEAGGLLASRFLNVIIGVFTVEEIYRFTRLLNLFDAEKNQKAALIAAFFASFSGIGIFVSRLATYDILSFFLLIFGINCFLKARHFDNGKYYFLSSISILFAFFTKIVIVFFFPPLLLISAFIIKESSPKQKRLALIYLFVPFFLGLFLYTIFQSTNLLTYFTTHKDLGLAETGLSILTLIKDSTYYLLVVVLLSIPALIDSGKKKSLLILLLLAATIPFFHLILNRYQTLNKHLYLTILFLSVIAGYGFSILITHKSQIVRHLSELVLVLTAVLFIFDSIYTVSQLQSAWTNTTDLQKFLSKTVRPKEKVLTENGGATILALYPITFPPKNVTTFDWINYSNLSGDEGYLQAIADVYFDYIELDGQFEGKSGLREKIKDEMANNYHLIYNVNNFEVYANKYK